MSVPLTRFAPAASELVPSVARIPEQQLSPLTSPPLSSSLIAHIALREARRRGIQRLLQALFRENLLSREHVIVEGAVSWLPLWSQQGLLRLEGMQIGSMGNCDINGLVAYYQHGQAPRPLVTPADLLACVAPALTVPVQTDDLQRLLRELENSLDNDVLCLQYRREWATTLTAEFQARSPRFIAAMRESNIDNPALLLEQWGTLGHPWHPTHKTKLGLSTEQVLAMSPEFQGVLAVQIAALRQEKAQVTVAANGGDYRAWFATVFPALYRVWEVALQQREQDPKAWLPLPVHPFQAQHVLPDMFAREIADGDLLLLHEVHLAASPTMSFRTVVPERSATMPHVKLPVSLRLTSVQRTVSPKSTVMGPRFSALLLRILEKERGFDGKLDIVPELAGLHYLEPRTNDERARHLSVLYRDNPMTRRTDKLFPIPVGALFADSPFDGRPLVTDLVALCCGDHAQGALQFFTRYAATVVNATLRPYLLYGIALEAHQQNSFIQVDESYAPVQLLVRDFGDVRVYAPTLEQTGFRLEPYRSGHTVYTKNAPVRDKLLHAVMLCHVIELGLLLARLYNLPEIESRRVVRREVESCFDALRGRTNAERWAEERSALLSDAWPAKSFLRMRLTDTSDDLHDTMPNPLALHGA